MLRFRSFTALLVVALASLVAHGQDLAPPSPFDLARGLREAGMADLALEYLSELSVNPPKGVAEVLPLERAKCQLELANVETDEGIRAGMVAAAKAGLDQFLKGSPNHPRTAEAAVALARLLTLEGRAKLQQARKLEDPAARKKEAAGAQPLFDAAAKRYSTAADGLNKLAQADGLLPARRVELVRDYYQALLDRGINLYYLAESYIDPRGKEVEARTRAANEATRAFDQLGRIDPTDAHPLTWVARAWSAEMQYMMGEPVKADLAFSGLLTDARRPSAPPGAAAGVRMARFFQLREQFVRQQGDPAGRASVLAACRAWLRDYPAAKPTAETYAVTYYLGTVLLNEALKRENLIIERGKPAKPGEPAEDKVVGVRQEAIRLLREADVAFRTIVRTDNEYTDRATRQRAKGIRWLVPNPDRPPADFATFDECYLAALVKIDRLRETTADQRPAVAEQVIALLERAGQLPVPDDSVRDAVAAKISLAQAYTVARRPYQAAVLAESVARASRNPSRIARAGLISLIGYQLANAGVVNTEVRATDRHRMLALCEFLESAAPNDPGIDEVRLQHGVLLSQAGRTRDMFEVLSRVSAGYSRLALARLYQGAAAYELVRPRETAASGELPENVRAELLKRAVADLSSVPAPSKSARPEEAAVYIKLQLQLAQLHLAAGTTGYPQAENVCAAAINAVNAVPDLPPDEKQMLAMRCEATRIKAVFGQVWPLFQAGKYAEAADKFTPLVAEVVKAGPAVKSGQTGELAETAKQLDADRIRFVLVPTLNARIREGAVSKTTELLDQLQKFGGDLNVTARVVQQGIASVKPTVDALRKDGKGEEATKLVTAVMGLVDKLAAEKNLPAEVRFNLGRSFKDLGEYAKAIALFEQIPPPTDPEFLAGEPKSPPPESESAEDRRKREAAYESNKAAAGLYRLARLELLRCHRLNGELDRCDTLLDEVLGQDRQSGWGQRFSDFRRETYHLAEAKAAAAATPQEAIPHWNTAIQGWRKWANEYKAAIDSLKAKAEDPEEKVNEIKRRREMLKPFWFDLMAEQYRCLVAAQAAVNKDDVEKLSTALARQAMSIRDFEKNNAPLPNAVRLKFHELFGTYPELKDGYIKAGGEDLLKSPTIDP